MRAAPEPGSPHDPPEVFDGVAATTPGDVLVVMWRAGASAARIRWVGARARELIARAPHGLVAVQLLLPSATPPGLSELGAVREDLAVVLPASRRLVVVPLGDAAWQSVVRGVMRAGLALLGQSERIRVAPSVGAALDLVELARSAATPARPALDGAVAALARALGAPPTPGLPA